MGAWHCRTGFILPLGDTGKNSRHTFLIRLDPLMCMCDLLQVKMVKVHQGAYKTGCGMRAGN